MINLRATYLSPEQIDKLVSPVLAEGLKDYGYEGKSIKEDETFDGDPIIRLRADVRQPVPVEEQVRMLSRIHDLLRTENDERIVFFSAPGPSSQSSAEDEDEDMF